MVKIVKMVKQVKMVGMVEIEEKGENCLQIGSFKHDPFFLK